jgi:hypothetical protein
MATRTPGLRLVQVKPFDSSSSVTVQTAGGNLGCCTCALLPTANGPMSIRLTLVIDGVHSGQRSTSHKIASTRSEGAGMSTMTLKFGMARPAVFVGQLVASSLSTVFIGRCKRESLGCDWWRAGFLPKPAKPVAYFGGETTPPIRPAILVVTVRHA